MLHPFFLHLCYYAIIVFRIEFNNVSLLYIFSIQHIIQNLLYKVTDLAIHLMEEREGAASQVHSDAMMECYDI